MMSAKQALEEYRSFYDREAVDAASTIADHLIGDRLGDLLKLATAAIGDAAFDAADTDHVMLGGTTEEADWYKGIVRRSSRAPLRDFLRGRF